MAEAHAFRVLVDALVANEAGPAGLAVGANTSAGSTGVVRTRGARASVRAPLAAVRFPPAPPPPSSPLRAAALRGRGIFDDDGVVGVPADGDDPCIGTSDDGVLLTLRSKPSITSALVHLIARMVMERPCDTRALAATADSRVAFALVRAAEVMLPGSPSVEHDVAQALECLAGRCLPGEGAWRAQIVAAGGIRCLAAITRRLLKARARPTPDGPAIDPTGSWRPYTADDAPALSVPAAVVDDGDGDAHYSNGVGAAVVSVSEASTASNEAALLAALKLRFRITPAPLRSADDFTLASSRGIEALGTPTAAAALAGQDPSAARGSVTFIAAAHALATLVLDEEVRRSVVDDAGGVDVLLSALHLAPGHPLTHRLLLDGLQRVCLPQRRPWRPEAIRRLSQDVESASEALAAESRNAVVARHGCHALAVALFGQLRFRGAVIAACELLTTLAADGGESQTRMGEQGVVAVVVACLHHHYRDEEVALPLVRLVVQLVDENGACGSCVLVCW